MNFLPRFPLANEELQQIKNRLFAVLKEKSFKSAPPGKPFVLTSGLTSPYYMDGKQTTSDPEGLYCLALYILHHLHGLQVDAVGGPVIGADPIVGAISALSFGTSSPLPLFLVRKQPKEHGTHNRIDGVPVAGKRVVVIEDVITTGGSVLLAIEALQQAGAEIVQTVCIVDREQGGKEAFAQHGIAYHPIFSIQAFLQDKPMAP